MRPTSRRFLFVAIAALSVLALTGTSAEKSCCFTHPSYSGTCEVVPEEGETCASILEYLNNQMSQGKIYCGGSDLRGGWELVSCGEP